MPARSAGRLGSGTAVADPPAGGGADGQNQADDRQADGQAIRPAVRRRRVRRLLMIHLLCWGFR
jgi:hypothetical protein